VDLTGKTLGNYQIMEEVGRGGMAVVYRAYQPSLHRYVAIKVLPPQLAYNREFVERFSREAKLAAGLNHPNIVVVHDVGEEQGLYYLVMEYLEGRTLKQVIQQEGALSPDRAARITEQIGSALDYAHKRGFVHRDVKPANIFVGEGDRVTLTDFGIAKAASEAEQLTRTGTLVGTPEYMSPEQAAGGKVDHRTDLYALGVVLYQMLTGQVPFRGTTPHAILHSVIYDPPPPLRQIRRDISQAVEAVVLKAVAKQPEQRFQTGTKLTLAFKEAVAGKPPQVVPVPYPAARPARPKAKPARKRSPVVWILAGLAAVLVVLLGALALLVVGGGDGETPTATPTQVIVVITHTPGSGDVVPTVVATVTPVPPEATEPLPTQPPAAPTDTATLPADTPIPPTDTSVPPTNTLVPPTATSIPPTATQPPAPTPVPPTPVCAINVDPGLAAAWERGRQGCPTAPAAIIWAAWEPFEKAYMLWRNDTDLVYVFYYQGGSNQYAGSWVETPAEWRWDGSNPDGVGLSPPPGLYEPVRGFGYVWRNYLGGPDGQLGWARDEEKGFCANLQPFEQGFIFHSSTVQNCQGDLFNWATHPSFAPLFFGLYGDGNWNRY
jgi:serine/threonine-protein kinase